MPKYKKIVLKLSGEALANENNFGIEFDKVLEIAKNLKKIHDEKIGLLVVIGGGNYWRGRSNQYMDSDTSDYVGMLGTTMNALVLGDALKQVGCPVQVFTRYHIPCATLYDERQVYDSVDDNVIIVGGGVGKPGHSTDSGAAASAKDIKADLLLKLSKIDGVYDSDPFVNKNAKKYDFLTFDEAISQQLKVMDLQAFEICRDNSIPICVFKMDNLLDIIDIANGKIKGSIISDKRV